MEKPMDMGDVLPMKWKGTIAVAMFFLALGGGGSTALWSFGPGAALADKVSTTNDGFIRLTEQVARLTDIVDRLERRFLVVDETQNKRTDTLSQLSSDVRLLGANSATYKAEMDGRLDKLERAVEKLSEKVAQSK